MFHTLLYTYNTSDMERLRSQLALAAFLQELGEAVEQAEVVKTILHSSDLGAQTMCSTF